MVNIEIRMIIFYTAKDGEALYSQQKQQNHLCSFPSKPFNITVIQVYSPTSSVEEAEVEQFYEDLQDLLELTPKKMSFSL